MLSFLYTSELDRIGFLHNILRIYVFTISYIGYKQTFVIFALSTSVDCQRYSNIQVL